MGNNSKENAVPAGGLSTAQHKYDNTNIVAGTSYIKPEDFDPVDFMKKITGFQDGKYMGFACKSEKYGMIRTNSTVLDLQNSLSEEPSLLNNNFLFCASLLREEKQGQRKDNCVCTGSIIVDMDYGTEGHRKASFFATEEDALNCLRTLPIKPSLVWNTGHGLQERSSFWKRYSILIKIKLRNWNWLNAIFTVPLIQTQPKVMNICLDFRDQ